MLHHVPFSNKETGSERASDLASVTLVLAGSLRKPIQTVGSSSRGVCWRKAGLLPATEMQCCTRGWPVWSGRQ